MTEGDNVALLAAISELAMAYVSRDPARITAAKAEYQRIRNGG